MKRMLWLLLAAFALSLLSLSGMSCKGKREGPDPKEEQEKTQFVNPPQVPGRGDYRDKK